MSPDALPRPRLLFVQLEAGTLEWWCSAPGTGIPETGRAERGERVPPLPSVTDVLVLPGEHVASHWLELPARSEAQALAVARHQLQATLASAPADIHVALVPPAGTGDRRQMLLVDRELLAQHLALAREAGAVPRIALPDYMLLPPGEPGRTHRMALDDRWLVRGDTIAFSADAALADAVLDGQPGIQLDTVPVANVASALLAGAAAASANLLKGEFAPEGTPPARSTAWRRVAALAVVVLASFPVLTAADAARHAWAARSLKAEAQALATRLAASPGAAYTANTALAVTLVEVTSMQPGMRIESLEWDAPGTLQATLRHDAPNAPGTVLETLRARGIDATTAAGQSEGASYVSTLHLGHPQP